MKKISYLLCILLVAICLTGCNDKKENTTPNINDVKELTPQEKYDKAMTLLESDEKSAIELLREIQDYKDVKTYIDNYDFKHRFDGTYFMFTGDITSAKETSPSYRLLINGLDKNVTFTTYQYNIDDIYLNGYTYYKGRYNTYVNKLICDETFSTCKQIVLSKVDENKYYQQSFNENEDDIYKISTYIFEKDLITEHTHYIKKIYNFDKDSTTTYKKISNKVELPPERQDTQQPKEPKVGMTKEEVERSTWGYPNKINKDTYSWGTREQWVYDKGYIYFRDDVVTSISER